MTFVPGRNAFERNTIKRMHTYEIETRTLAEQDTAVEYTTLSATEIAPWLGKAFEEVASYLGRKGAGPAGMPFARYHATSESRFEVEAGFPASTPTAGEGDVEPSDLPGGLAAVTVHTGAYDTIGPTYEALRRWVREHGGEPVGDAWEVYLTDPETQPDPGATRTEVVQPYRLV
jgi:effector-binding domain-containing protein